MERAFPGVGHRLHIPLSLFMTNGKGTGTEIGIEKGTGIDQLQRHSLLALHPIPYLPRLLPDTTGPMVIWVAHILLVVLVHYIRRPLNDFIHPFQGVLEHKECYTASQTLRPLPTFTASRPIH